MQGSAGLMSDAPPTFELGLSLAGGVSCGAYTAGVVDFLIEALDTWDEARRRGDPEAPQHYVRIVAVGAASSGAMTAALLTAVMPFKVSPVRADTDPHLAQRNPLYDTWVNMTGFADLLGSRDAHEGGVRSLLDPTPVERAARKAIQHELTPLNQVRHWVADPLRVLLSVADLEGVPQVPAQTSGQQGPALTEHGALLRFAISGSGVPGSGAAPRADEVPIDQSGENRHRDRRWATWGQVLADAAIASGAVPLLLPARRLSLPWAAFRGAELQISGCRDAPARRVLLQPVDDPNPSSVRRFNAVDGGLIDNTALHAVRAELNQRDPLACNPRHADEVTRAVLMVDPMLDSAGLHNRGQDVDGLGALVASLARMLLDQVRTERSDIALALDETVYSRFLISPGRSGVNVGGCVELAGASLGGFGGYLSREFRRHDYLLGRCNAQQALATHMTLPASHPLFACWTEKQRQHYGAGTGRELPVVPLMGTLHPAHGAAESQPAWPFLRADLTQYRHLIDARLQTLYYANTSLPGRLLLYLIWRPFIRPRLRRALLRHLGAGLRQHRLQ